MNQRMFAWVTALFSVILFTAEIAAQSTPPNTITQPAKPDSNPGPKSKPRVPSPIPGNIPDFPTGPSPDVIPDIPLNPSIEKLRNDAIERIRTQSQLKSHDLTDISKTPFAPLTDEERAELEAFRTNLSRTTTQLNERQLQALFRENDKKELTYQTQRAAGNITDRIEDRDLAADVGSILNKTGKALFSEGENGGASLVAVVAGNALSFAIDMTPGIGDAKAITEAILGFNIVTQERLSPAERVISAVSVLPFGTALRGARAATKFAMVAGGEAMIKASAKLSLRSGDEALMVSKVVDQVDAVVDLVDSGSTVLSRLSPEKSSQLATLLSEPNFRRDIRDGIGLSVQKGGHQAVEDFLKDSDPAVAMKIMGDLGWSARKSGIILPASVTGDYLRNAEGQWLDLLREGRHDFLIRLPTSSSFETAIRGQPLFPELIQTNAYNPGKSPLHPGLRSQQSYAGDAYGVLRSQGDARQLIPANLSDDYVVPVLEGNLNLEALDLAKARIIPQNGVTGLVPNIHFEADQLQNLAHSGKIGITYFEPSGSALKFSEAGELSVRAMPSPGTWGDLSSNGKSYLDSFVGGPNGIKPAIAQSGHLLYRVQRETQQWGRWYLIQPPMDLKQAERFTDSARFANAAEKLDIYVVKEKFSYFLGQNSGSAGGRSLQVFVPGQDLMGEATTDLSQVLRKVYVDFK